MSLLQKPKWPLVILLWLVLANGCAVPSAPVNRLPTTAPVQSSRTSLPAQALAHTAVPQQTIEFLATTPTTAVISPDNAAQLTSTAQALPEMIEYLLWPRPDLLLALSTGSAAYPLPLQKAGLAASAQAKLQLKMPENGGPLAFMPDASLVAAIDQNGLVGVYAPQNDGALKPVGKLHMKGNNASFSGDGKIILLTDPDQTLVSLYQVETGDLIKTLKGFASGDPIYTALISPDGKTVVWRARGSAQVQDVSSGTMGAKLDIQQMIGEMKFSPDGKLLAATLGDHLVVFSLPEGKVIARLKLSQQAGSLVFSPDQRLLAAAYGTSLQLWDTQNWLPLAPLTGHTAPLVKVSFSPDGRVLVSTDANLEMHLWKLAE